MSVFRGIKRVYKFGKNMYDERADKNSLEDISDPDVEAPEVDPEVDPDGSILESVSEFLGDLLS